MPKTLFPAEKIVPGSNFQNKAFSDSRVTDLEEEAPPGMVRGELELGEELRLELELRLECFSTKRAFPIRSAALVGPESYDGGGGEGRGGEGRGGGE